MPKTPVGITQISASAAREGQNNLFSSSERNKESALFLTESQHNNNDFIGAIAPIKPYKRLTREQIASLYKRPSPPPEAKNFALSELRQTEANSSVRQSLVRIQEKNTASDDEENLSRENLDNTSLLQTDNTSDDHINYLLHNPLEKSEKAPEAEAMAMSIAAPGKQESMDSPTF